MAEMIFDAGYRKQEQGVWKTESNGVVVCSNCGEEHEWDDYRPSYCEDCGARMKDDREE
jgi:predicted amidophosphoribosyltransferase